MAQSTTQPDNDEVQAEEITEVDYTAEDTPAPAATPADSETQRYLLSLVADPDVQKILAARGSGQDVEVVSRSNHEAEVAAETEVEESLEGVDEDIKRVVNILDKKISSKVNPLLDKIGALEQLAQGYETRAMNDQIKDISSKHKDFNKYRKEMAAIARKEGVGLGVEELFLLAKHRAGELSLDEPSTHSERPTPTPRRISPHNKNTDDKTRPSSPRKRFQVTLADALENLGDKF